MKQPGVYLLINILLSYTSCVVAAQLPANLQPPAEARHKAQVPMAGAMSAGTAADNGRDHRDAINPFAESAPPAGPVVISDVIGIERSINIFAGLTREVQSAAERLEDRERNSTVLAPSNSAMAGMGRKPWEDAGDYNALGERAYNGPDGEDRAKTNLRRFVERHIVPAAPWREGEELQPVSGDMALRWETESDGKRRVRIHFSILLTLSISPLVSVVERICRITCLAILNLFLPPPCR
jgi:hypothetical protein